MCFDMEELLVSFAQSPLKGLIECFSPALALMRVIAVELTYSRIFGCWCFACRPLTPHARFLGCVAKLTGDAADAPGAAWRLCGYVSGTKGSNAARSWRLTGSSFFSMMPSSSSCDDHHTWAPSIQFSYVHVRGRWWSCCGLNSYTQRFRPFRGSSCASHHVRAQYYSEYMVLGSTFLFREGRAKGIGKIRRLIN